MTTSVSTLLLLRVEGKRQPSDIYGRGKSGGHLSGVPTSEQANVQGASVRFPAEGSKSSSLLTDDFFDFESETETANAVVTQQTSCLHCQRPLNVYSIRVNHVLLTSVYSMSIPLLSVLFNILVLLFFRQHLFNEYFLQVPL